MLKLGWAISWSPEDPAVISIWDTTIKEWKQLPVSHHISSWLAENYSERAPALQALAASKAPKDDFGFTRAKTEDLYSQLLQLTKDEGSDDA